jgi:signal transduction histidine kinase
MAQYDIDRVEWALHERVKELTCLYGIARTLQETNQSLEERLQTVVELLPPAWQFPDIASARIELDGRSFMTNGYRASTHRQTANIVIRANKRGFVEVMYSEVSDVDGTPFLDEEQSLIEMVAREVAALVERHEVEEQKARLQEQLRHADRLATIGQLAAGVAHEINEPLANILGFAQLSKKASRLPKQVSEDLDKIVRNCLHCREVIQNLLTFARQLPPEKVPISLNQIVTDGLYFLESRCAKAGIEIVRDLDSDAPEVNADASQLHQVLVNLVVNAIQATPGGGTVTLATGHDGEEAILIVRDTGVGMTNELKANIFTPFFTTKDVNEGTGLGLAVVHGIVAGHGGRIHVESEPGHGSRFEIRLPLHVPQPPGDIQ